MEHKENRISFSESTQFSTALKHKSYSKSLLFPVDLETLSEMLVNSQSQQCIIPSEPAIIVLALDPSENSEYTLHFYLRYIHRPENKVYACYVAENIGHSKPTEKKDKKKSKCSWLCSWKKSWNKVVHDGGVSPGIQAELEKVEKVNYITMKSNLRRIFGANNVDYEFRLVTGSDPATVILEFRKEIAGTMIVMGSRGESAFKRQIFGSVSDKVLYNSLVPVLVVNKPKGAMQATTVDKYATSIH